MESSSGLMEDHTKVTGSKENSMGKACTSQLMVSKSMVSGMRERGIGGFAEMEIPEQATLEDL